MFERWEQGSEFHWLAYPCREVSTELWLQTMSWWGSGRDALRALLVYGRATRGWQRLWIPAYFCQEVAAALQTTGVFLAAYSDGPQQPEPDLGALPLRPGDVVLRVNFFGLRVLPSAALLRTAGVEVIDDYTHDPWSDSATSSDADWCAASLRKTLPIPDGGALWSPVGNALPPMAEPTSERRTASLEKLAAMLLKGLYLERQAIEKETYRRLALHGEEHIASGEISGMPEWTRALVGTFPLEAWRARRRQNYFVLKEALTNLDWLTVLPPYAAEVCPFSVVLVLDSAARRAWLRQKLIEARVYPAILWPLEAPVVQGIGAEFVDFSRRMLSVHCDMRYGEQDMLQIAELVHQYGRTFSA